MAAGLAASREGSMVSGIRDRSRETDQDSRDDSPTNNNQEKQMHVEENEGDEHDHDHENNADRTPQHAVVAADFAGSILSNRNSKKSGTALNTIRSTSPGKSALSANRNKLISGLKDGLPPSPRLEAMNEEDEQELNIEDQYIRNIKYGISSIDKNIPLKKFIVKEQEKKIVFTDQTIKDIRHFIDNYCRTKGEENKNVTEDTTVKKSKSGDGRFVRLPQFDEIQKLSKTHKGDSTTNKSTVGWDKLNKAQGSGGYSNP